METILVSDAATLAHAIRSARTRLGLSQDELARDAQVGRNWLVEVENGRKENAPLALLLRLSAALGIELTINGSPPGAEAVGQQESGPDLDAIIESHRQ